ncbi:MAG: hypothetical protein WBL93_13200 [Lutisporaceae bacterium]
MLLKIMLDLELTPSDMMFYRGDTTKKKEVSIQFYISKDKVENDNDADK